MTGLVHSGHLFAVRVLVVASSRDLLRSILELPMWHEQRTTGWALLWRLSSNSYASPPRA